MNSILRHIGRIVFLIILQALLINNLHWLGIFHPFIYVIGLILLPATLPRWAEMLIGAAVGLVMDTICSTAGVQMAACVAVAYFRPLLINHLVQEAQRVSSQVCSNTIGTWQFFILSVLMIILHHTLVIMLEAWSMQHLWWSILTIFVSSAVTFVLTFLFDRSQR